MWCARGWAQVITHEEVIFCLPSNSELSCVCVLGSYVSLLILEVFKKGRLKKTPHDEVVCIVFVSSFLLLITQRNIVGSEAAKRL